MKLFEGLGKERTARLNESFPFIDGKTSAAPVSSSQGENWDRHGAT